MLEAQKLSVSFGSTTVMRGVSFRVEKGRSLAIIGPASCGKSVLLKTLVGLIRPKAGKVLIQGRDRYQGSTLAAKIGAPFLSFKASRHTAGTNTASTLQSLQKDIGFVFQQNALFDGLCVWENITFQARRDGLSATKARAKAVQLLRLVGLAPFVAELFPADLSGGMQKRVALARALATDAAILLLDAPTAGLDPIRVNQISQRITDLSRQRGTTTITVSSNMAELENFYDDVAVLYDGIIQWHGPARRIHKDKNPYLRQLVDGQKSGPIKTSTTLVS